MRQKDWEFLAPYGDFGGAMKRLAVLYKMPPEAKAGVSIDDFSTWRAVRFADRDETVLREPENRLFFRVTVPLNLWDGLRGGVEHALFAPSFYHGYIRLSDSFRCG